MAEAVLDATAVLAVLLGEAGADAARPHLSGALISALNYSEILARTARLCGSLDEARRRVDRLDLSVVAFDAGQAAGAASLAAAARPRGLSLADRACLALGVSRGATVVTADGSWGELALGIRIVRVR